MNGAFVSSWAVSGIVRSLSAEIYRIREELLATVDELRGRKERSSERYFSLLGAKYATMTEQSVLKSSMMGGRYPRN